MTVDEQKRAAARAALHYVKPGMKIGLGTGSTCSPFIDLIGDMVEAGFDILCVPTSEATRAHAERRAIPLTTLEDNPQLDLTFDGADEIDPDLNLLKGGGGALLREKIVATSSRQMIVMADISKKVETLGAFPLPVEVVGFGVKATAWKIERAFAHLGLGASMTLRVRDTRPFVTDNGHLIIDCALEKIPDAPRLAAMLSGIPGVVEHGLFIGIASLAICGTPEGVKVFTR